MKELIKSVLGTLVIITVACIIFLLVLGVSQKVEEKKQKKNVMKFMQLIM